LEYWLDYRLLYMRYFRGISNPISITSRKFLSKRRREKLSVIKLFDGTNFKQMTLSLKRRESQLTFTRIWQNERQRI